MNLSLWRPFKSRFLNFERVFWQYRLFQKMCIVFTTFFLLIFFEDFFSNSTTVCIFSGVVLYEMKKQCISPNLLMIDRWIPLGYRPFWRWYLFRGQLLLLMNSNHYGKKVISRTTTIDGPLMYVIMMMLFLLCELWIGDNRIYL